MARTPAHFFYRWGTPVYTHLGRWKLDINNNWVWQEYPSALERVTFRPFCPFDPNAYNGERIEDLCDLGVNSVSELTCTSSSGVPGVDGNGYFLRFEEFEGATWALPLVWWLRPDYWERDIAWWWQDWYTPGEYLMDPPAGSANDIAILQEAARQSASKVVRRGAVIMTRLTNGVATCKGSVNAVLPASE